ncbi:TPA: hypothetical protein I6189_003551 [Vibrio cholerae]|nr:hypothetical protein [Vibrio cholerae]
MGKCKVSKDNSLRSYELSDAERIAIIRHELYLMRLKELNDDSCSQKQTEELFDYQISTRFREFARNAFYEMMKTEKSTMK